MTRRPLYYVRNLVGFAIRENPLLCGSIALSICSVAIELLAMSSLLPLFELMSGTGKSPGGLIPRILRSMGFVVSPVALLWAFIALFSVRIVTQVLGQVQSTYFSKLVMAQLGSRAFEQIVKRVAIREISERSIGFYIGLAGDEAFRASTLVMSLTQLLSTLALASFYYLAILLYSRPIGILVIGFLLCTAVPYLVALRTAHRLGDRQTEQSRQSHSIFLDALNNLKTVRAFSAETYVAGLYRSTVFQYARTLFRVDVVSLLIKFVPMLLLLGAFAVWLLSSGAAIEHVGVAFIVTMIVYLMRFFPVLGQAVMLSMKVASDAKAGRDVTSMVTAPALQAAPSPVSFRAIDSIELSELDFWYDEKTRLRILSALSLRLERGRSYALTGRSGIGKSTMVDLLLKFYAPSGGVLRINSTSMADIAEQEIRARIILVTQEPAIFDDTIAHNVGMGRDFTPGELQAACRKAEIHDLIEAMPEGYGSRLQYQGRNLSGGQRQRIALARALVRKPDVLVLDEATSALDKETQAKVLGNVLDEYADRIVIMVTHDPQVISLADEVIDLGKLNFAARVKDTESVGA